MKNLKRSLIVLLSLTTMLMIMGMTFPQAREELIEQLKQKTMKIVQLEQTITQLNTQITDYQIQLKNDKIALEPARFASESGNSTSQWLRNPDHLKNVWKWTKQYRYLLTPEAEATAKDFNVEYFAFVWFFKESHYNPYAENKNKNGSMDWGMAQINDVCWEELYKHIPEELKKRKNPKQDAEIAVVMLYEWINHRVEMKWSYCYLSPEGWTLVWRLQQING